MARKTIVVLQDDLDGGPADETLHFGIGGLEYEIDLSEKNAARLRKQLAPFVEHARKAGRAPRRVTRTAASRRRSRDIRAWAREQGIPLSERGRIPASVVEQYEADGWGTSRRSAAGVRGRGRLGHSRRGCPAQGEPFRPIMSRFRPAMWWYSLATAARPTASGLRRQVRAGRARVRRCAWVGLSAAADFATACEPARPASLSGR
jgi:Lsr2